MSSATLRHKPSGCEVFPTGRWKIKPTDGEGYKLFIGDATAYKKTHKNSFMDRFLGAPKYPVATNYIYSWLSEDDLYFEVINGERQPWRY